MMATQPANEKWLPDSRVGVETPLTAIARDSWTMTFVVSTRSIAVGILAGLASALLVLSPVGGSILAFPLTILIELPLVIAALGWGTQAAIVGSLAGAGALLAISPGLSLYLIVFLAPPAAVGGHLAGLFRRQDDAPESSIEWYPLGRILFVVGLLVAAGAIIVSAVNGFDPSSISPEQVHAIAAKYAEALGDADTTLDAEQFTALMEPTIATTLHLLPFAFTVIWTLIAAANLALGLIITAKSGNLARPSENFSAVELPKPVTPLLGLALVASSIGGPFGSVAFAIAGSMAGLLLIGGLAVLHTVTRGFLLRLPLLILVYLFIGLFAVPLVILGALEPYLHLKQRISLRKS